MTHDVQQDRVPCYFHRIVRNYLNDRFEGRWIDRGAEYAWPPRSSDMTPLGYFLWGFVKPKVYETCSELFLEPPRSL